LAAGEALAHEGATGLIAEPMAVMNDMGEHLKAISDMLTGHATFDAASVRVHARALSEQCIAHSLRPSALVVTMPARQQVKRRALA
jgi:cytochrome c556